MTSYLRLMGKKRGMTQMFDEQGHAVPCTVIEIEPNVVVQRKTSKTDGYSAVQLGFDKIETKDPRTVEKRLGKPLFGHYKKASVAPRRFLKETRVAEEESFEPGQEVSVAQFQKGQFVDVVGTSKGKGYQGTMKKYNFKGGPAAHGSGFHRHSGSTGMRSTPGHCLKGGKRPSHMGANQVTVQNLKIIEVDEEENILVVNGAIPGANNGFIWLSPAVKKRK